MTASFAAPRFGGGLAATLRAMPATAAVGYVLLATTAVALAAVALLAGLLSDLTERLAAAGWVAAAQVRAAHPAPQPGPPPDPGPGSTPADFGAVT